MDHCLSFTGGFGDLPYLSTIPFHLQLLNLQFSNKFIYHENIPGQNLRIFLETNGTG